MKTPLIAFAAVALMPGPALAAGHEKTEAADCTHMEDGTMECCTEAADGTKTCETMDHSRTQKHDMDHGQTNEGQMDHSGHEGH